MVIAGCFVVATFLIFIEETRFIIRHFEIVNRRVKTIWVLAIYPVSNLVNIIKTPPEIFRL